MAEVTTYFPLDFSLQPGDLVITKSQSSWIKTCFLVVKADPTYAIRLGENINHLLYKFDVTNLQEWSGWNDILVVRKGAVVARWT